jgi:hypothetical protein
VRELVVSVSRITDVKQGRGGRGKFVVVTSAATVVDVVVIFVRRGNNVVVDVLFRALERAV